MAPSCLLLYNPHLRCAFDCNELLGIDRLQCHLSVVVQTAVIDLLGSGPIPLKVGAQLAHYR